MYLKNSLRGSCALTKVKKASWKNTYLPYFNKWYHFPTKSLVFSGVYILQVMNNNSQPIFPLHPHPSSLSFFTNRCSVMSHHLATPWWHCCSALLIYLLDTCRLIVALSLQCLEVYAEVASFSISCTFLIFECTSLILHTSWNVQFLVVALNYFIFTL